MSHADNIQFTMAFTVPEEHVAEGDRIFESHASWMERTHHKAGEKALLTYDLSKTSELEDPMDPESALTGNSVFVLSEVYETPAGLNDHWKQAGDWEDFGALMEWMENGDVSLINGANIVHSLW